MVEETEFRTFCRTAGPQDLIDTALVSYACAKRIRYEEFLQILENSGSTMLKNLTEMPDDEFDLLCQTLYHISVKYGVILRIFPFSAFLAEKAGDLIMFMKERIIFLNSDAGKLRPLLGLAGIIHVIACEEYEGRELDVNMFV